MVHVCVCVCEYPPVSSVQMLQTFTTQYQQNVLFTLQTFSPFLCKDVCVLQHVQGHVRGWTSPGRPGHLPGRSGAYPGFPKKSLHAPRTTCPGQIFKTSSNDCNELNFCYKHLDSVKIYHCQNFITCLKTL